MDIDIDIDIDKFYENISKVSIKNNNEFREKLNLISCNLWNDVDIYTNKYNVEFFIKCNEILGMSKQKCNMPNLFLISLLLNIPTSELININENWNDLHLLFKKYFRWRPISFDNDEYWNQVDCTCSHHIVCKCFIDCLYTGVQLRVGVDCFKKTGFINPNIDEIQSKRNKILKEKREKENIKLKCIYLSCKEKKKYGILCENHYNKLITCKFPICEATCINGTYINDYCRFHHFQKIDKKFNEKLIVEDHNKCKVCGYTKDYKFGLCSMCIKNYKNDLLLLND